jgi:hypothetical protein
MASGNGGQIAMSHIASLGTQTDTLDIWTNFKSDTLEHVLAELEEGAITGRRDAPESYKGIDEGKGDIVFEPNPNALTHLMKGFFGISSTTLMCDAGSVGTNPNTHAYYHHFFTPRVFGHSKETFLNPFNVMVYKDVGSAFMFRGAIFPSLKFEINAGALAAMTGTVMAREVSLIDYTPVYSANLKSLGGRPWVWDMASVEVSSTGILSASLMPNVNFEKLAVTLALPHTGVINLDGTKLYHEFSPSDYRRITFDGTLSFRDLNEYLAFRAYEDRRMRITLLNVNSSMMLGNPSSVDATGFAGYYGMRFHFPRFKFTKFSAPITGPNRITASFTAKAQTADDEGYSMAAEMLSMVSSTDLCNEH